MFFLLSGLKSEQANREHRNPAGKHRRYFFHIFTTENMENASVLVCGKTPKKSYFVRYGYFYFEQNCNVIVSILFK